MGMEGFLWGRCRGIATRYTEPLGNAINLVCFVDSDHVGNLVMHCSHTRIHIFIKNAPLFGSPRNRIWSSHHPLEVNS